MILNRLEPGTQCTVRETGQSGVLKQIYFYPTKFELEFPDGSISHFTTKQLDIDGITQVEAKFKGPSIPKDGKGESWNDWYPFHAESKIEHHFSTTKEIMWKMLTSLDMYNIWFFGIQRSLPIAQTDRYVHQYSFKHFDLAPGKYFKIRPKSLAPYFKCRIMTIEKEKEFGFTFRTNPFLDEYIHFSLRESEQGVWLTCERKSDGIFSILSQFNWEQKSKIFQKLNTIIPKVYSQADTESDSTSSSKSTTDLKVGGFESLSIDDQVAYLVNKGLDGDMDSINAVNNKVVRGKTKAMIVKINRGSAERPPMPEIPSGGVTGGNSDGGFESLSIDDQVAYLVNKGLDGDMDSINAVNNKVIRGKTKAMIVKIKRGSVERPPMPEIPSHNISTKTPPSNNESEEELIKRLIAKGLEGDMEEINNLEDKVLRGKIKAAIVKEKRKTR